jgi:hypothetical protein
MLVAQYHEAVAAAIAATTAITATYVKWIHHHVFVNPVVFANFRRRGCICIVGLWRSITNCE